jgi:hypothetical protein
VVEQTGTGWRERLGRPWSKRFLALVVTLSLVATTLVIGEPNRPATANVVRPIVTVQALCTAPTIIDVAAGEPTRGLSAVNSLLGLEDPLIAEAARDVTITETDAGTFFVSIREGQLRLSILRPTGLPALADAGPDTQPQTYRAFDLPVGLADLDTVIVPDDDAVFVLFAGGDEPISAIRLDLNTLVSDSAGSSAGRAPEGVELAQPSSRPGAAVAHARVLWVAADDGSVWSYDPAVDASDRWAEVDRGLDGGVLASDDDLLYGVFSQEGGGAEVRGFAGPDQDPVRLALPDDGVAVEAASFPASKRPGFVLRDGTGGARLGVLHVTGPRADVVWTDGGHAEHPAVGAVLHDQANAVLSDVDDALTYHVTDHDGGYLGAFHRAEGEAPCVSVADWSDAADVVTPLSAGPFLHLHDPSSQFDCVVDTRGDLAALEANCAPDGPWSVDKGAAPDSDFTIEVERAVEEFRDDREITDDEDGSDDAPEDTEVDEQPAPTGPERLEDEFADVGLGIQEVDEDLTEICAEEEVTAVVAPELDALAPVGDRGIRVDWTWAGGRCLPERYEIDICMVSSDGSGCSEERTVDVHDRDGASNRLSYEVSSRPGRSYRLSVTAFKKGVASSASNTLSVTTPPTVPAPPSGVSADLSSSGVWTISWESCLDDRSCDQRPEGFRIAVQGCDGDSLQRLTHDVGADQRSVSYDVSDGGFRGNDLLGRKVRFTVAAMAAGYESDAVEAGACQESVRPGMSVSYGNSPVDVPLSGRTTRMTLDAPGRGNGLTRLFGTSSFDDVSARLVRSNSSTGSRNGALGSSVNFEVQRCELSGWTVELTPRRGGASLTNHQARITGVPAACDWAVTDGTQSSAKVTGGNKDAINVEVTIPGLAHDVRTDKVDSVSAKVECSWWNGGTATPTASGAKISGDKVNFSVATPAVFDLRDACSISPRIHGNDGETVVPKRSRLDVRPVQAAVVERLGPSVVSYLKENRTTRFRGTWPTQHLDVTFAGSGIPCSFTEGASSWEITARGPGSNDCSGADRRVRYTSQALAFNDLDGDRGEVTFRVRLSGGSTYSITELLPVCRWAENEHGERKRPCGDAVGECEWQDGIPEDDPDCFEPCWWDPDIPADHRNCPDRCGWDPDIPADDPDCVEPPDEEPPEEPGDPEEPGEDPEDPGDGEDPGDEDPGEDPGDPGDEDPEDPGDDEDEP